MHSGNKRQFKDKKGLTKLSIFFTNRTPLGTCMVRSIKGHVDISKGIPMILHMLDWKTQNPISPRLASIRVKSEYCINRRDIKIPISCDCPFSHNPKKRAAKKSGGGFCFLSKF
jgi:hypothetical protein